MSFIAQGQAAISKQVEEALRQFQEAGAEYVEVSTLLPADVMLDLYGEDIRNRAFLVHDGVDGDFVLRPDFTVPVLQGHIERARAGQDLTARYSYSGRVWRRKRSSQSARQHSFWQVGMEIFSPQAEAKDDAEIFDLAKQLAGEKLTARTGDLGLVFSLLDAFDMPSWRREALKRQFWRPAAFEALLQRYASPSGKYADLDEHIDAPVIGLRSEAMIRKRIARLKEDASLPRMKPSELELLREVLALSGDLSTASDALASMAKAHEEIQPAALAFASRNQALEARGIDPAMLAFDASFGRETMEYYDGFVFGFYQGDSAVISGGRYDRLAKDFGAYDKLAAVGLAFRPEYIGSQNHEAQK